MAAAALVERKGHQGFSMRELARELGVTEPALYRHYEGRDALLAEVALRGFEAFVAAMLEVLDEPLDPFEAALQFGKTYVRFAFTHPGWFRLQFSRAWNEELGRRPGVGERQASAGVMRLRILERLCGALPAGDDRVADLYRLVWGAAHGLATFVVERVFQLVQTDEERIAAADEALTLLVDSLRARAEAAPR